MINRKIRLLVTSLSLLLASDLMAKVSPEEAAKLGTVLTPGGATLEGNADGTIPKWTGGYNDPSGYTNMGELKDPYPDDKILFTITGENADKYKDKLSVGQYAMLKKHPTWKMNVYPTRRTQGFTDEMIAALKHNALNAELISDGNGIKNSQILAPFPIPKSGLEIVWNQLAGFLGSVDLRYIGGAPTVSGSYQARKVRIKFETLYSAKGATSENTNNILNRFFVEFYAPPLTDGTKALSIVYIDSQKDPQQTWTYDPGTRRVRRVPVYTYDSPLPATDGQIWYDMTGGFSGAPDRYDFKFIEKKELYVPYNCYKLTDRSLKYDQIVKPGHFNPEYLRYELHRVSVVELTLKSGMEHVSPKRTLYIDEDTGFALVGDFYDSRSNLWRLLESYEPIDYVSYRASIPLNCYYDLINGRYGFNFLRNE